MVEFFKFVSRIMNTLLAMSLLSATLVASVPDLPVVGTLPPISLNGQWSARGATRDFRGNCTYELGVDYNPGAPSISVTPVAYHGSLQQCCQLCGASAQCALSVWDGSHCYFKTTSDLAHRVTGQMGKTACSLGTVGSRPLSINATVPGDLVTDLERAGIVNDPLLDTNFQNATAWAGPTWTYSKQFSLPPALAAPETAVLLVFDGIKQGAHIELNGKWLGNATNQHRRWVFEVGALVATANLLTVTFDIGIATEGRYMYCSGGWDWAPYSFMRDIDGSPTWTKGIWRGVYLLGFDAASAAITYMVPRASI